ncbi:hypothetical protein QCA50_000728 [Cerrena zonata]|uniref:F-box domain-containing protein n=1 Tax=Cerrena zonata TaxID=2478898 RepID=A0AAW0H024_9APHY
MDSILRIADLVIAEDKWQREPKTFSNTIIPNDLIHNLVFFFCSPGSLLCLSRTCSSVHTMVQAYMQRVFKIERILSRFFTSPISFRRIQAETGTLISGSTILQFFDRSFYPKSDLDLYVSWISDYFMIADFLSKEGYKYVPRPGQHAVFNVAAGEDAFDRSDSAYGEVDEVLHVFTWKKYPEGRLEDPLRIQLIVSTDDPINVILGFHSSESGSSSIHYLGIALLL